MVETAVRRAQRTLFGAPLATLCWFVVFLATLDGWMTVRLLESNAGHELNPAMRWMVHQHGVQSFVLVKVALTGLCMFWVHRRAPSDHGRKAMLIALAIYLPIAVLHIINTRYALGSLL